MWSLLFGLGGFIFEWIAKIYLLMTLKEWATIGACCITLILGLKVFQSFFEFLKVLLMTPAVRWIMGIAFLFSFGYILGYCSHKSPSLSMAPPTSHSGPGKSSDLKEIKVRKLDSKVRSHGIVKDGKIYYPGVFVNKHLERKGSSERFKETYPFGWLYPTASDMDRGKLPAGAGTRLQSNI